MHQLRHKSKTCDELMLKHTLAAVAVKSGQHVVIRLQGWSYIQAETSFLREQLCSRVLKKARRLVFHGCKTIQDF